MEPLEQELTRLRAENALLVKRIVNKTLFSSDLDIYRTHNSNLVNALESEADLSYDHLDKHNPELLRRLKSEAPGLFQKLVDQYVIENEWIMTGKKPSNDKNIE